MVRTLLAQRGEALLVTGLGSTSWDAASCGDRAENFYLWGAMGGAAMLGLGLALAQPRRRVMVLTGDGEQLMGLGALATLSVQAPKNLAIVVIDNERYGETGMQATHTGSGVDLAAVARACGIPRAEVVRSSEELDDASHWLFRETGPLVAVCKVAADGAPMTLPPRDGSWLKARFRAAVTGKADD